MVSRPAFDTKARFGVEKKCQIYKPYSQLVANFIFVYQFVHLNKPLKPRCYVETLWNYKHNEAQKVNSFKSTRKIEY